MLHMGVSARVRHLYLLLGRGVSVSMLDVLARLRVRLLVWRICCFEALVAILALRNRRFGRVATVYCKDI